MKKTLLLIAMAVLMAAPAMALNIRNTKHNLGRTGDYAYRVTDANGTTQICIFCHTPHNAKERVPLWNRNNPSASGFQMYTSSTTLQLDKGVLTGDSISLFCLSCHDGGLLGGRVVNTEPGKVMTTQGGDVIDAGAKGNLGSNLTNDHPINFDYDEVDGLDGDIRDKSTVAGLRFFRSTGGTGKNASSYYLECATCHDVHGAGYPKFLRKSNDSSSLCLTCHRK
jgi:predicted CXXCH cytochrome family protein